jgi:hypothetical protein
MGVKSLLYDVLYKKTKQNKTLTIGAGGVAQCYDLPSRCEGLGLQHHKNHANKQKQ